MASGYVFKMTNLFREMMERWAVKKKEWKGREGKKERERQRQRERESDLLCRWT
jgi:hypothetical protein